MKQNGIARHFIDFARAYKLLPAAQAWKGMQAGTPSRPSAMSATAEPKRILSGGSEFASARSSVERRMQRCGPPLQSSKENVRSVLPSTVHSSTLQVVARRVYDTSLTSMSLGRCPACTQAMIFTKSCHSKKLLPHNFKRAVMLPLRVSASTQHGSLNIFVAQYQYEPSGLYTCTQELRRASAGASPTS